IVRNIGMEYLKNDNLPGCAKYVQTGSWLGSDKQSISIALKRPWLRDGKKGYNALNAKWRALYRLIGDLESLRGQLPSAIASLEVLAAYLNPHNIIVSETPDLNNKYLALLGGSSFARKTALRLYVFLQHIDANHLRGSWLIRRCFNESATTTDRF